MAETRSSSTPCGRAEAILKPSTLTTAEASISGDEACNSRKRSTICCERFFVKQPSKTRKKITFPMGALYLHLLRILRTILEHGRQCVKFSTFQLAKR